MSAHCTVSCRTVHAFSRFPLLGPTTAPGRIIGHRPLRVGPYGASICSGNEGAVSARRRDS
eukprot:4102206-Prymnesium_polylepis.1